MLRIKSSIFANIAIFKTSSLKNTSILLLLFFVKEISLDVNYFMTVDSVKFFITSVIKTLQSTFVFIFNWYFII